MKDVQSGGGYRKPQGTKGISSPKSGPPKTGGAAGELPFQGKRDSAPGANDNKQSAR